MLLANPGLCCRYIYSDIGFTAVMAVMFVVVTALSREGLFVRKFKFNGAIWPALLIGLTLSTLLQPDPWSIRLKP